MDDSLYDGVSSIFLISRSNCAFVNFDTEAHLNSAIKRFNGKPLRPNDTRCPRLVCRVRRKDDDLKAGVGGQRGMGIHTRWIKEKAPKVTVDDTSPSTSETASSADQLGPVMAAMSLYSDEEHSTARKKQSSSGSYASTNSSILTRYFPKRYFILKSLTQVC
jgi:RNA recognition motif-containing protein